MGVEHKIGELALSRLKDLKEPLVIAAAPGVHVNLDAVTVVIDAYHSDAHRVGHAAKGGRVAQ
jgi:hypothetical protein